MKIFSFEVPEKLIYVVVSVLISYFLIVIEKFLINGIIKKNNFKQKHLRRSQNTVLILIQNIIKYVIIVVTILSILKEFGFDTTVLVTSVGAVSVIIGLAFQDILKDILVGATIILESQFAIGEIIEIDGFKGEVVFLSLKTTRIKSATGEVKIIANRNISNVINYSLNDSLITFNISVSYEDDIEKVEEVLNDMVKKLPKEVKEIKNPVYVNGIDELSKSAVVYRISTLASDRERFVIRRQVNKIIKNTLHKNGIKIPYPQIEVHNGK